MAERKYQVVYPEWDTDHEHGYIVDDEGREWVHDRAYRGAYTLNFLGLISIPSGGELKPLEVGGIKYGD